MKFYTSVHTYGHTILLRGVDENGKKFKRRVKGFRPSLFVPNEEGEYSTIQGKRLKKINPGSPKDCKQYIQDHVHMPGFEMYGLKRYEYQYIHDFYTDHIDWDMDKIDIMYIDIEVDSKEGYATPDTALADVISISMKMNGKIIVLGLKDFETERDDITYVKCDSEVELLHAFLTIWENNYPDVVTGWYIMNYDIPYLINRITRVLGEDNAKRMSPWNFYYQRMYHDKNGRTQKIYVIYGVGQLDYIELYKKFAANGDKKESYTLNYICSEELDEKKVNYDEYESLSSLYENDFDKFIRYNIHDVELVEKLNDKLALLELALTLAYDSKCNYEDVFSQVRMWTVLITNKLKEMKVAAPLDFENEAENYMGAYVKEPIVGKHNWIVSFDLTSLYPHLIMMFNISPDTIIDSKYFTEDINRMMQDVSIEKLLKKIPDTSVLKKKKITLTPNRQLFRTDRKGFLSMMMEEMFRDRKRYKNKMLEVSKELEKDGLTEEQKAVLEAEKARYNNLQLTKKICLNSAYGALGNEYFMLFDVRQAEGITSAGQLAIRWIINSLNRYLNDLLHTEGIDYVIASDTDSVYISLDVLVNDNYLEKNPDASKEDIVGFIDEFCKRKVQPFIEDSYTELGEYLNVYEQKMDMKRELICEAGIWTAKKRYALNVWDSEGVRYHEPKLKISGLEAIKSSTPNACRKEIKESIKIILGGTEKELQEQIKKFRKEYDTMSLVDIGSPRSVNNIEKEPAIGRGLPIQVSAARTYNRVLTNEGLNTIYESIRDGEKIKYVYLRVPNRFQSHVMGFMNYPPKEFELEKNIDRELQFQKTFIQPLKKLTDLVSWSPKRKNRLF